MPKEKIYIKAKKNWPKNTHFRSILNAKRFEMGIIENIYSVFSRQGKQAVQVKREMSVSADQLTEHIEGVTLGGSVTNGRRLVFKDK